MGRVALLLVIIGALNWLLVGVFGFDLVSAVFGGDATRESSVFSRIIYTLVGLAGIYSIRYLFENRETANDVDSK